MFEGDPGAGVGPLPEYDDSGSGSNSFFHKIFSKSETMIPIVLIIILVVILALAFSGWDYSNMPVIGGALESIFGAKVTDVLVIGQPHPTTMQFVINSDDFKSKFKFRFMDELALEKHPENILKGYDFVLLDQSDSSTLLGQTKAVPYKLAEALKTYVASGNSLVIVGNSGHVVAKNPDSYGWVAVFGDMSPMDCLQNIGAESPCEVPLPVHAILVNAETNTKVFYGIDEVPDKAFQAQGVTGLDLTVYNTNLHNGVEWMYIKDVIQGKPYPGIVVNKSMLGGKVVYFAYEQLGMTPNLVMRVFDYIK